jgi:FtsH-binding integral membrane protein
MKPEDINLFGNKFRSSAVKSAGNPVVFYFFAVLIGIPVGLVAFWGSNSIFGGICSGIGAAVFCTFWLYDKFLRR